jgi:hypothetical protein
MLSWPSVNLLLRKLARGHSRSARSEHPLALAYRSRFCHRWVEQLPMLITNAGANPEVVAELRRRGVEVQLA